MSRHQTSVFRLRERGISHSTLDATAPAGRPDRGQHLRLDAVPTEPTVERKREDENDHVDDRSPLYVDDV